MRYENSTNGVLARVKRDLERLIEWAEADAEGSREAGAEDQAIADGRRANMYRRALEAISDGGASK